MNATDTPSNALSALEISGAISSRIIHDLSNLISGILGNAEYAQQSPADPASVQKALHAITLSANAAGKLLGQCLPLQRLVAGEAFPIDAKIQAEVIAEAAGLASGWRTVVPPGLAGQIRVQPRWLSAAIWQIAREAEVSRGDIEFLCGPAIFPVVWRGSNPDQQRSIDLFQIRLSYRSDQMLFCKEGPVNPERHGLLAAHELIRRMKGQIHSCLKPPGRQEISVLIPLLTDNPAVSTNGH
jgi:hypothetical protein